MSAYLNLKRRHQLFVDAYVRSGGIASKALVETGYRGNDAKQRAHEIMRRPEVQAALAERVEESLTEAGVTNHRILTELAAIAFSDVTTMFDDKGNLKPMSQWPETTRAAISAMEVEEVQRAGSAAVTRVSKFKLSDKIRALEILAKYKKLLVDQVEFPAGIPLVPPVINIGFGNGGPGAPAAGTTIAKRDPGTEGS